MIGISHRGFQLIEELITKPLELMLQVDYLEIEVFSHMNKIIAAIAITASSSVC